MNMLDLLLHPLKLTQEERAAMEKGTLKAICRPIDPQPEVDSDFHIVGHYWQGRHLGGLLLPKVWDIAKMHENICAWEGDHGSLWVESVSVIDRDQVTEQECLEMGYISTAQVTPEGDDYTGMYAVDDFCLWQFPETKWLFKYQFIEGESNVSGC